MSYESRGHHEACCTTLLFDAEPRPVGLCDVSEECTLRRKYLYSANAVSIVLRQARFADDCAQIWHDVSTVLQVWKLPIFGTTLGKRYISHICHSLEHERTYRVSHRDTAVTNHCSCRRHAGTSRSDCRRWVSVPLSNFLYWFPGIKHWEIQQTGDG